MKQAESVRPEVFFLKVKYPLAEVGFETDTELAGRERPVRPQSRGHTNSSGSEIRKLGRHTAVYALGVGITKLAGFIMLPVYTRFLTPADYGVLELLTTTIDLIGTVMGIGIAASVFKFHAEADSTAEQDTIVSTAALSVLVLAIVTSLSGLLASPGLAQLLLRTDSSAIYFRLFFVIYFLQTAESIPLLLLRAQNRSALFVTVSVTKLLSMLSLNIYFVVMLKMGVLGVLLSNLIVSGISSTLLSTYLVRQVGVRFSKPTFMKIARFGHPLVVWFVANFIVLFSDRYFINHYIGPAGVGIYSLAAKFVVVLSAFAFTPFQMIWDPQRFAIAKRPDAGQIYSSVFFYLNLGLAAIALGIGLFVFDTIRVIADPAFRGAAAVVPVLLAAQIIFHWAAFSNFGLFQRNRTQSLAMLAVFGVVAVLGLNFLLIPTLGIQGAALASLGAYSVRFVAVYFFSQRQYRIHYPWSRIARLYAVVGCAVIVRQMVNGLSVTNSLMISALLAITAFTAIYIFVLSDSERSAIKRFLSQPRMILSFGSNRA